LLPRMYRVGTFEFMKLAQYLSESGISFAEFGEKIGVTRVQVSRLASGQRRPSLDRIEAIFRATDGRVGPADFLDLPRGSDPKEAS